ncbi:MAG: Crp/Fnr family transcriptional regulator [Deltaproteobacteria bacterium]|jgi:CRP-like cAMP-binding protein|nr:Crp/Fnr family transcriptional regulator [Deltaproteobacteria bacterium]
MSDLTTNAVLEHNFTFRYLPPDSISALATLAHRRTFEKNVLVFSQGDPGDALYGIASGRVRIFTSDDDGHEVFLNVLGPGDTFGEIALLDGQPRTAGAMTVERSTLVVIPRENFLTYLEHDSKLALHMMRLLCERLRWVSDIIDESVFLTGPARVAKRLLRLLEIYGRPVGDGEIELVISQAELGHFLGISRQIVNQYLRKWCDEGLVCLKRGRILVKNPAALRELSSHHETEDSTEQ